ncbi:MAG: hypothetical protein JO024_04760 [Candidatus Eremiobacteraeota bacterium]|nr:hypothetical protein [Candidatus Eremiobacteraeota bacterium]
MRRSVGVLAFAILLSACGGGGGGSTPSTPSGPPKIPTGFNNGVLYDALGDSVTAPYPSPNQNIVTFPQVTISLSGLSIALHDLADGHSNFISSYQSCHSGANGSISAQITRMDVTSGFATIEIGIDEASARAEDVLEWQCRQATAAQDAAAMLSAYQQAIAQIHLMAPLAQIVLLNDANITHFPCSNPNDPINFQVICTPPYSAWYVALIKGINGLFQPNGALAVADVACDAALYDPNNFVGTGLGGLHPNQTGQNIIAQKLLDTIRNPNAPPQADCAYLH